MALIASTGDPTEDRLLQRRAEHGELRRLYQGVYTDDLSTPINVVTRRHLNEILGILAPGAVISHRSAIEHRPTAAGRFYLTGPYRRELELPGIKIHIAKGPGPTPGDIRIPFKYGDVYISNQTRALLENLSQSRGDPDNRRTLGPAFVEQWLERFISRDIKNDIGGIRDQAKELAGTLGFHSEAKKIDALIGAMLGTRTVRLVTPVARARAAGRQYDDDRLTLFERLANELQQNPLLIPDADPAADLQLQAFVETYFSNFIEGTEFEIEEAHDIVVNGRPLRYREDDSHDILGTYQAILRSKRDSTLPGGAEKFVAQIMDWNRLVIESRKNKSPGEFKALTNRAGHTVFVQPDKVVGTLMKGYEIIMSAATPANRAALAMFVIAEVHPFNDGNGRTARIAMNHFLTNAGLTRIVIPTIYRDDYISALKAMTHGNPAPLPRMLNYAGRFSRWIDFSSKERCFHMLERSNAMKEDERQFRLEFDEEGMALGPAP